MLSSAGEHFANTDEDSGPSVKRECTLLLAGELASFGDTGGVLLDPFESERGSQICEEEGGGSVILQGDASSTVKLPGNEISFAREDSGNGRGIFAARADTEGTSREFGSTT